MTSRFYDTERTPVRISLGCHVEGAALPVPDLNYAPDQTMGVVKRVAARMPNINPIRLRKLKRFTQRFMKKHFTGDIFPSDTSFDVDEWLEKAPYEAYRKEELKEVYEKGLHNLPNKKVKGFIKDEPYGEYKHVRGIYSRHDDYKVRVGPFFKKFGDVLFSKKWFIKKIPVNDRPSALLHKFADHANIFCTDFSQFEATFVRQLMSVELIAYRFMLQNHPQQKEILDLITKGMMSTNVIEFYKWTCHLLCKRMSGEMNTSCSNGLMNLLITFFLLEEAGNKDYDGYFEGDDGICYFDVRPPTEAEYLALGAKIKIERPDRLSVASFCGNVFDETDLDNVVNPMEALVSFGWTNRQYMYANESTHRILLKAKSLSLLYQYSGCPILRSLALYGLRVTNDIPMETVIAVEGKRKMGLYFREQWLETLDNYKDSNIFNNTVKSNTRLLVQTLYLVPIAVQLEVEQYLDGLTEIQPLQLPQLNGLFHPHWTDYYSTYHMNYKNIKTKADLAPFNLSRGYQAKVYTDANLYFMV